MASQKKLQAVCSILEEEIDSHLEEKDAGLEEKVYEQQKKIVDLEGKKNKLRDAHFFFGLRSLVVGYILCDWLAQLFKSF